jgi:Raf kinase inhibitor-like YbhB/YbcL family protein
MFRIKATAFPEDGNIPARFTCEGENISPKLTWEGAPAGTKTFALIVDDPDAPKAGGFTHWVAFNIPATVKEEQENVPGNQPLPGGGVQGTNDAGNVGYTGPCPPSGTHRYYFRLYALDRDLELPAAISRDQLDKAMRGHVLAKAELMGKYKKASGKAA